MAEHLYFATVTVTVLVHVDEDPAERKIGGQETTPDEHAAWDANNAASLLVDAQERIDHGGYPLTIASAEVARLQRVVPGEDIEPNWFKTEAAQR
jgi:hypothetical protein